MRAVFQNGGHSDSLELPEENIFLYTEYCVFEMSFKITFPSFSVLPIEQIKLVL